MNLFLEMKNWSLSGRFADEAVQYYVFKLYINVEASKRQMKPLHRAVQFVHILVCWWFMNKCKTRLFALVMPSIRHGRTYHLTITF